MAVSSIRTFCFCFIRRWPVPAKLQSQCHLPSSPSRSVPSSTFILPPVLLHAPWLALFTCLRFRVAARRALEAASIFPLSLHSSEAARCTFFCSSKGWGEKNIKACSNTPSTFPSRLADAVASVQAPIVEPSPSRTSRATTPCVVRLPHHRCSVTAWPWRRPVMFRFRMHTLPPAFRELRGSAARNPGPKKGFLGCCHR